VKNAQQAEVIVYASGCSAKKSAVRPSAPNARWMPSPSDWRPGVLSKELADVDRIAHQVATTFASVHYHLHTSNQALDGSSADQSVVNGPNRRKHAPHRLLRTLSGQR